MSEIRRDQLRDTVKHQSTSWPTFPEPCAGDRSASCVLRAGPNPQELTTVWGRQTGRVEPNGLLAGALGEVNPGTPVTRWGILSKPLGLLEHQRFPLGRGITLPPFKAAVRMTICNDPSARICRWWRLHRWHCDLGTSLVIQ